MVLMSHLLVTVTLHERVLSPLVSALCLAGCARPQRLKLIRSSYMADMSYWHLPREIVMKTKYINSYEVLRILPDTASSQ